MDPITKEPFPEMELPVAGSSLPLQGDMLFNAGRQSMSKPGQLPHMPSHIHLLLSAHLALLPVSFPSYDRWRCC